MTAKVYFISCNEARAVKVGWAVDVAKRLRQHQCGCPYELSLIFEVDGGSELERRIHLALTGHGIRGEWFQADAVDKFIADVAAVGVDSAVQVRMDSIAIRRNEIATRVAKVQDAIAAARPDLLSTRQTGTRFAAELITNRDFRDQVLAVLHDGSEPDFVAMARRVAA